jgi:hypothetical protein
MKGWRSEGVTNMADSVQLTSDGYKQNLVT